MLKITLEQWRMFKAVVDHGGFNQASHAIHKSQSSIHHAVSKLEQSLGVALLEVNGRKTTITPAGELVLRRANFLLDEATAIENIANNLSAGIETNLHIAVDEAFPQTMLYCVLDAVSAEFPLLRIQLHETVLNGANELLDEGKATLGLSPIRLANGVNEEICQVRFIPIASPTHPLHAAGKELTLQDLKTHRQIVVRDSALHTKSDSGWLGAEQRWTVSHIRTSIDLVCRGLGFTWLPEEEIQQLLDQGRVKRLPLAEQFDRTATFFLNYRDADQLGPAARAVMGELRLKTLSV